MTAAEWQASDDPPAMIRWLAEQGYFGPLWQFTIASCRRVWDDLPGNAFRGVVEHFEQIGVHDIDDALSEAYRALDNLKCWFRKAEDAEQDRLSRRIGFGRMVFAFEHQDAAGAARSISSDLVEWADDAASERRVQAELLRQLVPDPSQRVAEDDAE
jgi:hypothetical protein